MTDTPATRFSLIGRLHDSRDADAWAEFVQIYQPMIFRIAQSRGLQHADAAEVAQEVLGRVAQAIGEWKPSPEKGSFRGWLYRITRNLTVDYLRKNRAPEMRRDSDTNFDLGQIPEPAVEESRQFLFEFERQLFNWAANIVQPQFKPSNWKAFWLTTVGGLSIKQAAEQLKLKTGTVYVARSRVMAKIASLIATRMEETNNA